jgi:S-formylglutathione hydrolase FrmB
LGFHAKLLTAALLLPMVMPGAARAQTNPAAAPSPGNTVEQRTFFSAALQREMPYDVVLPAGYAAGQQRYAVLYLLHGWNGDQTNWVKRTHLVELVSRYPLIVVAPRAGNSWYVNSATHEADRYADYIVADVIADVDSHYRTIADAHERAIVGLSMGGYGALLLTFRHPGVFGFAASVSGAFAGSTNIVELMPGLKPSLDEAFGTADSATRRENDMDALIASADPAKTPYLFLECGTTDPLLALSRHVVAELSKQKFAYEYHELPGAHTWTFWDHSLPAMLDALSLQLHLSPNPVFAVPSFPSPHR